MLLCVEPLYHFFDIHSRFNEGIALFQLAVEMLEETVKTECNRKTETVLGRLLVRMGSLAHYGRKNQLALEALERSQEIFTRLVIPDELAFCRSSLGGVYLRAKDFPRAELYARQNLDYYRETGDHLGETRSLYFLGLIQSRLGKRSEAKNFLIDSVNMGRKLEDRRRLIAPLNVLGDIACSEGNYAEAEALFRESLDIANNLGYLYYQAILVNNLAEIYYQNGRFEDAQTTYEDSLSICRRIGDLDGVAIALNNLSEVEIARGEFTQAVEYSKQALEIARQIGEEWTIVVCLNILGEANIGLGNYEQAMGYLRESILLAWEIKAVDSATKVAVNAGRCFQLMNYHREAADLYQSVIAHSAAEYDMREKATGWLSEMGLPEFSEQDDSALGDAIARIFSNPRVEISPGSTSRV